GRSAAGGRAGRAGGQIGFSCRNLLQDNARRASGGTRRAFGRSRASRTDAGLPARKVSYPIHSGCCAVPSNRVAVLNNSNLPLIAASRVFATSADRSEEHTSELQSLRHLVCRLLLEKKKIHTSEEGTHPTLLHAFHRMHDF